VAFEAPLLIEGLDQLDAIIELSAERREIDRWFEGAGRLSDRLKDFGIVRYAAGRAGDGRFGDDAPLPGFRPGLVGSRPGDWSAFFNAR
jgi:hypothetical protein